MYEGLVQFLMNKCPFNPISRVIRFKFQQYIARVGRATGEMLDKPVPVSYTHLTLPTTPYV